MFAAWVGLMSGEAPTRAPASQPSFIYIYRFYISFHLTFSEISEDTPRVGTIIHCLEVQLHLTGADVLD